MAETDTEDVGRITGRVARMAAKRVYGEPVTRGDVTVIPAAVVLSGAGGGSGRAPDTDEHGGSGMGSGYGMIARPVGAWVIKDGKVRWRPAVDVTRLVVIGAGVVVLLARALRPRR
jgi:uncharacterized spore protein YtfJ